MAASDDAGVGHVSAHTAGCALRSSLDGFSVFKDLSLKGTCVWYVSFLILLFFALGLTALAAPISRSAHLETLRQQT